MIRMEELGVAKLARLLLLVVLLRTQPVSEQESSCTRPRGPPRTVPVCSSWRLVSLLRLLWEFLRTVGRHLPTPYCYARNVANRPRASLCRLVLQGMPVRHTPGDCGSCTTNLGVPCL